MYSEKVFNLIDSIAKDCPKRTGQRGLEMCSDTNTHCMRVIETGNCPKLKKGEKDVISCNGRRI